MINVADFVKWVGQLVKNVSYVSRQRAVCYLVDSVEPDRGFVEPQVACQCSTCIPISVLQKKVAKQS